MTKKIRDDEQKMSMKIVSFSRPLPPPSLSIYVQIFSTPLVLDVQF